MDAMNKTIYMTYKKNVPEFVFSRWKELNPDYSIEFSLDNDCIDFLKNEFNDDVAELFKSISVGMYKADLWRLCKLYKYGGVYADVDLVPYINIDKECSKDVTFYTCLSIDAEFIFQAFMINNSKPKNPLIFIFLLSYLIHNPIIKANGPAHDMAMCLIYNLNIYPLIADKKYKLNEVKLPIVFGSSSEQTKYVNLIYFPNDIKYRIELLPNEYNDTFTFEIKNNVLKVVRTDKASGWGYCHVCNLIIKSDEMVYLFSEKIDAEGVKSARVEFNGKKILDSRDPKYYDNGGW